MDENQRYGRCNGYSMSRANEVQVNTQIIPPFGPMLASMPSGRDIHPATAYTPPTLEPSTLESMRAPPDHADEYGAMSSDDDGETQDPVGAFPGTKDEYTSVGSGSKYY